MITNLKKIRFRGLEEINPATFNGLINLEEIDISHNRIEKIEPDLFKNLVNLKKINLSFNSLDEIHPASFVGLINLEEIDLSFNTFLENFDIDLSNGLDSLKSIKLDHTEVTSLNPALYNITSLRHLK